MSRSKYSIFGRLKSIHNKSVTISLKPYQINKILRFATSRHPVLEIRVSDGRTITPKQRDEAYALIGSIASDSGYTKDEAKAILKEAFTRQKQIDPFSLSNTSETNASHFIDFLMLICFKEHTPLRRSTTDLLNNSDYFKRHCLKHHICIICGNPVSVLSPLPLCSMHERMLQQIGKYRFQDRYHLSIY